MRGPVIAGGGGVVGIIVVLLITLLGGNPSDVPTNSIGGSNPSSDLAASCQTGADANQREDCRIVGVINSIQAYWSEHVDGYRNAQTVFFTDGVNTGCGGASSAVGPFYCQNDRTVYIDLGFYQQLRDDFGAKGGPFAEAYVIAHEYGHHVENVLGVFARHRSDGRAGEQGTSVRLELQADCLAGRWAQGAVATGFIEDLSRQDIADGLDAAAAVGDDRIQEKVNGQVDPESFTHGSAAQRQKWFMKGYEGTSNEACDTFAVSSV